MLLDPLGAGVLKEARRHARLGIPLVLYAGFGSVLALMAFVGVESVRAVRRIEAANTEITRIYLARREALSEIRSALDRSGASMRDYLLEPQPDASAAALATVNSLHDRMNGALQEYAATIPPDDPGLFSGLRQAVGEYWQVLTPALRWNAAERRARGYDFLHRELSPRRQTTLRIASTIDAVDRQALKEGDTRSAGLFRGFRRRVSLVLALTLGLGLLVSGGSVVYTLRLENETRLRYAEAARARRELQSLSARLVQAQEEERRAISRELHDEVGQSLGALLVEASNLAAVTPPASLEAQRAIGNIRRMAEQNLNALRNMALLLRPSMLDDLGLVPALHWHAREISRRTGLRVDVHAEEAADELPDEYKTCVYRVVQEALQNCSRHAGARTVRVAVRRESERVLLSVQDDGKGFDTAHVRGLGLIGMEERVRHLGGIFRVDSRPGAGTLLAAELPLPAGSPQPSPAGA